MSDHPTRRNAMKYVMLNHQGASPTPRSPEAWATLTDAAQNQASADRAVVTSLEQAFRDEWGRVLATLIGFLGDFELAEEAAQEAFAIAAERWPREGTPDNPGAWLTTTARNRAINRIHRDRTLLAKTRLAAVLAVVYLIFNEGYAGRNELATEALRLGRSLAELMPDEPEVQGLLALMLLHDSRRDARFRDGERVLYADQDRSLWHEAEI